MPSHVTSISTASEASDRYMVGLRPADEDPMSVTRHFEWHLGRLDGKNRLVCHSRIHPIAWYCGEFSDDVVRELRIRQDVDHVTKEMEPSFPNDPKIEVYVIDSGVYLDHEEFEGRARHGIDLNGNGTHVAGIIAGRTFGVAKRANIILVKVGRDQGNWKESDICLGVEWLSCQHNIRKAEGHSSVANISICGPYHPRVNSVVDLAVAAGIHFTVAAGNGAKNACLYSPASVDGVITVGSVDGINCIAWDSNHGPCVDLFAPGVLINSAWIGSPTATKCISGTSMASPHVAGSVHHFGESVKR